MAIDVGLNIETAVDGDIGLCKAFICDLRQWTTSYIYSTETWTQ